MSRLAYSLRRKRAIEAVAREEFDRRHGREIYGSAWQSATPAQRKAAIGITTATIERFESALAEQERAAAGAAT